MSRFGAGGHWIDRLAVETTRRQSHKAAIGAVMLAVPLGRASRASASHPTMDHCQKGCMYTAAVQYRQRRNDCFSRGNTDQALGFVQIMYGQLFAAAVTSGSGFINEVHCREHAVLAKKAMQYDCLQPGCPGFNPDGPGGPCEPCATAPFPCQCCPDPESPVGYVYMDPSQECPS